MIHLKKLPILLLNVVAVFALTVFLISPAKYAGAIADGISLWGLNVLPSTFPFLFLTALLSELRLFSFLSEKISPVMQKIFRISGEGGALALLSALSGYPVGARLIADLHEKGRLAKSETLRLACLCSTSGPMFLVGVVGCAMFKSAKAGWITLLSHLTSVWIISFLLRFSAKPTPKQPPSVQIRSDNLLYDSVYRAVISVLCVGGFIAIFYAFGQMCSDIGLFRGAEALLQNTPFAPYAEGFFRGLLEMTTGCAILSQSPTPLALALSCFLVTFGGVCVLCQQLAFLSKTGLSVPRFLLLKFVQALLAALLCYLLASLCGVQ